MSYNKDTDMYEGYIYCIENLVNNKKYIGQTTRTVDCRWKQHISTSKNSNADKYPIHLAINKYGEENFKVHLLDKYTASSLSELKELLNAHEIFFIEKYNLTDKKVGYNLSIGGGVIQLPHKKVKQYSVSGQLIKCWNSIKDVCDFYEVQYSGIIGTCTGLQKTCIGYVWRYENDDFNKFDCTNHNTRKVIKYDMCGNFISEYASITEAAQENNASISHVSHCCMGKNKTCKGFVYRHEGDSFNKYSVKNRKQDKDYIYSMSKKINCYTIDGEFIKTYDSLHIAQVEVGLKSSASLTAACKGQSNSAGGYKWFYADDKNQPDKTKIIA